VSWYRANGKAFFLNYWYQSFMVVDEKALELINTGMPSNYAAMSPLEFFAEIYALYYDLDDPQRGNLPPAAVQWLDEHIGGAQVAAPSSPLGGLAPAHRSGGTRIPRPGRPDLAG
jgi:hypothetical protein